MYVYVTCMCVILKTELSVVAPHHSSKTTVASWLYCTLKINSLCHGSVPRILPIRNILTSNNATIYSMHLVML